MITHVVKSLNTVIAICLLRTICLVNGAINYPPQSAPPFRDGDTINVTWSSSYNIPFLQLYNVGLSDALINTSVSTNGWTLVELAYGAIEHAQIRVSQYFSFIGAEFEIFEANGAPQLWELSETQDGPSFAPSTLNAWSNYVASNTFTTTNAAGSVITAYPSTAAKTTTTASTTTASSSASASSTPSTAQSTSTSTSSPSPTPSSGLSTGAKVGLGVAIPLGVAFIGTAVAFYLYVRRRRRAAAPPAATIAATGAAPAEMETANPGMANGGGAYKKPTEGAGYYQPQGQGPQHEMDGGYHSVPQRDGQVSELGGGEFSGGR
ncbi:MAG: hypothetical protein M1827_000860 [Pycnora praestabilis]|nr:MAG: hypothetical protein M1827_000860 [Pycnora praestabilis]